MLTDLTSFLRGAPKTAKTWPLLRLLAYLTNYQNEQESLYYKHRLNHKRHITGQNVGSTMENIRVPFPPGIPNQSDSHPLDTIIIALNDSYKWTREQIADWLDTLDEQPVFYPEIEQSNIEDEHRIHFVRMIPYGPSSTEITFACGCLVSTPFTGVSAVRCGYCVAAQGEAPFGYNRRGFNHDCRKCPRNPDQ